MRKIALLLIALFVLMVSMTVAQDVPDFEADLPDFIADARTDCEYDLTGQTVEFWHLGDLSGPYGPITQPILAAFDDITAYFNERGGICGAELVLPDPTTIDTGGDQEQTQIIYDRVSSENPVMVLLYSSDDSELLREQLAEDQIPSVISAGSIAGLYGESGNEPGWVFATNPLYAEQFGQFCEYAGENMESPVVGYISWPTAFGTAAFTEEAIAYCAEQGVTVLEEPELFAPGSDISGQVQNLVDAGANILYTNTLATGPAEVAATVTNLGLSEEVQVAGVNWTLDTSVGLLGLSSIGPDGAPSVNGLIGSMPFAWWTETENPGIQLMTEIADANERDALTRNIAYILGTTAIDIFIEAYVQTVNRVGPENVDGVAFKETLEGLNYSTMQISLVDFQDGAIRDTKSNRMAVLTYAGVDGGTILDGQAPLLVDSPNGQIPIPVVVPLEDFRDTPELLPSNE